MNIKYFIRGLGFGILATTLVIMISGQHKGKVLTDEEIISRARTLGMMTQEEFEDKKLDSNLSEMKESINKPSEVPTAIVTKVPEENEAQVTNSNTPVTSTKPTSKDDNSSKKNSKKKNSTKNPTKTDDAWSRTIHVKIESGMVSQTISKYFYQKGLVGSASDFNNYLKDTNNSMSIIAGEYDIPLDATYAEIVDIITK